jgi:hypothetical protein
VIVPSFINNFRLHFQLRHPRLHKKETSKESTLTTIDTKLSSTPKYTKWVLATVPAPPAAPAALVANARLVAYVARPKISWTRVVLTSNAALDGLQVHRPDRYNDSEEYSDPGTALAILHGWTMRLPMLVGTDVLGS